MSTDFGGSASYRPKIALNGSGEFTHDGSVCRVVMRKNLIHVACTDVTPEALRALLAKYDKHFGAGESVVIQAGI